MSVLTREKKTRVSQPGTVNITTDLNPVVPGAVDVSGTLEPEGVMTATQTPQAGEVSRTALPLPGSTNVTRAFKVDEDGLLT